MEAVRSRSPRNLTMAGWAAVLLFGLGIALRLAMLAWLRPAFLGYVDSTSYLTAAHTGLFSVPVHTAGYPLFLRAAHLLSAKLTATILLQHALGVLSAAALFGAVRRISGSTWLALAPAAVLLLDGLQIWTEHAVMTETLFTFLLVTGLSAALLSLGGSVAWMGPAALLLTAAGLVRTTGLPVLVFLLGWAITVHGPGRRRLAAGGQVLVAAVVLMLPYAIAQSHETGRFGLSYGGGRVLYSRVAPFADCAKFTPPAGTRVLCERTPPARRQGTNHYLWIASNPAYRAFGPPGNADAKVRAFAMAAIRAQPGAYADAVSTDFDRLMSVDRTSYFDESIFPEYVADVQPAVLAYYSTPAGTSSVGLRDLPFDYARRVELPGLAMWLVLLLSLASVPLTRGRERRAAVLLAAAGPLVMLASIALANPDPRYSLPVLGVLVAGAAFSARAAGRLARAWRGARRRALAA